MFDVSIYNKLVWVAKEIIHQQGSKYTYNEIDVVNDLYLEENNYDFNTGKKRIKAIINISSTKESAFNPERIKKSSFICTKCNEILPPAAFRIRTERRTQEFRYINSVCRQCELKNASIYYYTVQKLNEDWVKNNRNRAKKWRVENRSAAIKSQRERRKDSAYREYVREYYQKNREKIRAQAKAARLKRTSDKEKAAIKRATPEYKLYMQKYRLKNKERDRLKARERYYNKKQIMTVATAA